MLKRLWLYRLSGHLSAVASATPAARERRHQMMIGVIHFSEIRFTSRIMVKPRSLVPLRDNAVQP